MTCSQFHENAPARVVVVGLASCFGCQLQITNDEAHLLDVLGQIDLQYWQLASSAPEPEGDVDVVVIEGAVTTEESRRCVERWRERARTIITIGACAVTGGIPGMASKGLHERLVDVYGETLPDACGETLAPRSVSSVVEVDFEVRSCPIDTADFIAVLERALYGSNVLPYADTMCGSCKRNESCDACGVRREMRQPRPRMQRLPRAVSVRQSRFRPRHGCFEGHERRGFQRFA